MQPLHNLNYPNNLKEVLVVCRKDDQKTIIKTQKIIEKIGNNNIKLLIFNDLPINKPHSLNVGLRHATKDIVAIFDAEDQPHKDILNIVNDVFIKRKADVVQSGVQLMNYRSNWFSTLNVLEYFFWFKSSLHFFAAKHMIPLGGNTVFFKRYWLERINGWDENCLTEDADVGIRLSTMGADIEVVYDEIHATQEETPSTSGEFIRQRTRWIQGFIQLFGKGEWRHLPTLQQKILASYILFLPVFQALFFLLSPLSIILAIELRLPFVVAFLSFIPMLLLFLQLVTYNIGLYEFTKHHKLKFPLYMTIKILITFYPYQFLLGFSAIRAIVRILLKKSEWEKTLHVNAHRTMAFAKVK